MCMGSITAKVPSTTAFLELPEAVNQEAHFELLEGEVVTMPKPSWEHNYLASSLMARIARHARRNHLGKASTDCLVVLDEAGGVVVAPDVVYLSTERVDCIRQGRVHGVPNLVAEVLSPSSEGYDRGRKLEMYHRYGVEWVWLVSLEPLQIEEYQWTETEYRLVQSVPGQEPFRPHLFPNLSFRLSDL